jgi:hypothetical protein
VHARYRPSALVALSASYQADFRLDGRGVYSELAAVNGTFGVGGFEADASIEVDAASAELNEAKLRILAPTLGRFAPFAEVRRYRPYFELWTIWGAFSPIGFDEARGGATWSRADGALLVRGDATYRSYGSEGLEESLDQFRVSGWGLGGSVIWTPEPRWTANASGRIESGFGASGWDTQAGVRMQLGRNGSVALHATAFERLYEFRLSGGIVAGLGSELSVPLRERTSLLATFSAFRHLGRGSSSGVDWNQRRASLRLQWTLGSEPGRNEGPVVPR